MDSQLKPWRTLAAEMGGNGEVMSNAARNNTNCFGANSRNLTRIRLTMPFEGGNLAYRRFKHAGSSNRYG